MKPISTPGMRVGGRLQHYLSTWQRISMSPDIISIIHKGYQIPFSRRLPTAPPPHHDPILAQDEMTALDAKVCNLISKGSIELATQPGFTSCLFCIPKKNGELHPVLNLQPLNTYIRPQSFKMETMEMVCHLINKDDYLTSLDLQDAFHHIPVHVHSC